MVDWNEHEPDVIGLEFVPSVVGQEPWPALGLPVVRVDAPSYGAAATVQSTTTEYLEEVDVLVNTDSDRGRFLMEMFEAGDELIDADDIDTTIVPVASTGNTEQVGRWKTNLGAVSASAFATALNNDTDDPLTDTYISPLNLSSGLFLGISFQTGAAIAGDLAGRRILDVTVKIVGGVQPATLAPPTQFPNVPDAGGTQGGGVTRQLQVGFLLGGGIVYPWNTYATAFDINPQLNQERSFSTGEILPRGDFSDIQYPWSLAALAALENIATAPWMYVEPAYSVDGRWTAVDGDTLNIPFISRAWLEVTHCRENRLSADYQEAYGRGPYWYFMFPTPIGASQYAGFDKFAGTDLSVLVRQPAWGDTKPTSDPADDRFSLPYLKGSSLPAGIQTFLRPGLNADGTVSLMGDASDDAVLPVNLNFSPPSPDSAPYGNIVRRLTNTGETFRQQLATTSAGTYDGVLIPLNVAVDGAGSDLVVELRRTSDDVLMATATIDPDDALAVEADGAWRRVQAPFAAPVALAGGTGYYTEIAPVGGGAVWSFPVLTQFVDTYLYDDANTYGQDVLSFEDGAAGQVLYADQAIVIYQEPEAPGDFTATPVVEPPAEGLLFCGTAGIQYATLEWTQPTLGLFLHYEIQRLDPYSAEWQTIATLTDPAVLSFVDREPARGGESGYRIRQVNVVGVGSEWATATADIAQGDPGLTFTSNVLPELGVGLADVYDPPRAVKDYPLPGSQEVTYWPVYGRDDWVATRPADVRGPVFTRRLLVNARNAPDRPGLAVFQPLLSLTEQTLPYICVRDQYGDRWFADVTVSNVQISEPGHFYFVDVTVRQTARLPYPVDSVA